MAISEKEFRQMQKDIREIKRQLARRKPKRKNGARKPAVTPRRPTTMSERERVREILRRAGMLGEPTAEEKRLVEEWRAVPHAERERLLQEFRSAKLDKPLSQIIIENRR